MLCVLCSACWACVLRLRALSARDSRGPLRVCACESAVRSCGLRLTCARRDACRSERCGSEIKKIDSGLKVTRVLLLFVGEATSPVRREADAVGTGACARGLACCGCRMQWVHWLGAGWVAQGWEQLQCSGRDEAVAAAGRSRGQRPVVRHAGPLAVRAAQHVASRARREQRTRRHVIFTG